MRIAFSLAAATLLAACTQSPQQPEPKTDDDKALYTIGVLLSQNLRPLELTDQDLVMVKAGLHDGSKGEPKLKPEELEAGIQRADAIASERMTAALERRKQAGAEYLAKAAAEPGAVKTDSGLVFRSLSEGSGASPTENDTVRVHYEGRFVDGKVFDSSRERNQPAEFPLFGVIPCWGEGVQKMKVGGTARLVCPSELAYGDRGNPPQMPGGSTLVFDIELLDIVGAAPPAPGQ
jgi:FKBP-type peptidyl-prolyl cis-trans isomerase